MINLDVVKKAIANGVIQLFGDENSAKSLVIEETKKDFRGDLTLVCFPLLRYSKKSPEETAKVVGEYLINNEPYFEDFNVVKGFLNLSLKQY